MTTNLELRDEPPYNVTLKAENERLRAALKPFADEIALFDALYEVPPDERMLMFASDGGGTFLGLSFGDLRRAANALNSCG